MSKARDRMAEVSATLASAEKIAQRMGMRVVRDDDKLRQFVGSEARILGSATSNKKL